MDIDASTEVGEIAQAFSDITTKLRDSQKNMAEQERLQKEMQVAKEIQQTLLPTEFPEVEGYELSSFYEAAKEVGGDYFDFVEVDKDTLGIVVADVSGKGVPGSLVMTMIRTALRTEARGVKSASEVLARVNDFVVNDMKKGMFVTLFYVIIDSKRRRLNYASAGHNPMILYRVSTKQTYYLNPRGFPIGISLPDKDLFRKSIESDTIQLAEDDILIVYTDGITEAMNPQRHLFGEERFLQVIRKNGNLRVEPFVTKLKDEIHSFTEGNIQNDDITLVAIREKTSAEKIELDRAKKAHQMILQGKSIREACEMAGVSIYAYYNKYKEVFENEGIDGYEVVDDAVRVEAKHLSIEEKTKIFDIIRLHPDYGAKRISEELDTERYDHTNISVSKIYEELVRSRLNTRELREAFVKSGGRKRRRFKPPGTPMLTLDGQIIMQRSRFESGLYSEPDELEEPSTKVSTKDEPAVPDKVLQKTKKVLPAGSEKEEALPKEKTTQKEMPGKAGLEERGGVVDISPTSKSLAEVDEDLLLTTPLEDLLQKEKTLKTVVEDETFFVDDNREIDLQGLDSFDYASSSDEDDLEEATAVSELEIEIDSRLFDKIDSEELDVARLIESNGGLEFPEQDQDETEPRHLEPTSEELVQEYSDFDMTEPSIEDVEIIEDEVVSDQIEPNGYDFGLELSEPFDEFLEIEEEQGLVSSEGEIDTRLSDKFVDELDSFLEETAIDVSGKETNWDINETEPLEDSGEPGPNEEDEHELSFAELMDFIDDESFSMSDNGEDSNITEEHKVMSETSNVISASSDREKESRVADQVSSNSGDLLTQDKENILCQQRIEQALRLYDSKDYIGAVKKAKDLVNLYPDLETAHTIVGNSYFRLEKYKQAAQAYEKAKELDPQDVTARENLGVVYANQGDLRAAIREWEKVLEIDPNRSDIYDSIARAKRFLGHN